MEKLPNCENRLSKRGGSGGMGIPGFWKCSEVQEATRTDVSEAELAGARLVNTSLYLERFQRGLRDEQGGPLPNALLVGFFGLCLREPRKRGPSCLLPGGRSERPQGRDAAAESGPRSQAERQDSGNVATAQRRDESAAKSPDRGWRGGRGVAAVGRVGGHGRGAAGTGT